MILQEYDAILGPVGEHVEGCPAPTVLSHIRRAAIRVCEETLLWRYAQDSYLLTPGVHEYPYQKPVGTDVHVVFSAIMNDFPMEKLTLEQALNRFPAWAEYFSGLSPQEVWSMTPSGSLNAFVFNDGLYNHNPDFVPDPELYKNGGEPRGFCQLTPDKYVVLPQPNAEKPYKIKLIYALKPKRDSKGMPQEIFSELEDAIIHQAVHTLLALPGNPWTDTKLAMYHGQKARYHMSERRARANHGNARGVVRVQYNRWA